jgi:ubiquinone biosynthesis protein Coq4
MALKLAQATRSFLELLRDPFDYPASLRFAEAVSRTDFMRALHGRMVHGIPREEQDHLRALTEERLDRERLRRLPERTFGHHYVQFLDEHRLDPDSATTTHPPLASLFEEMWILRRFIKIHDMHHVLAGFLPDIPGEMGLLVFDLLNFNEPYGMIGILSYPLVVRRYGQPVEIAREMWRGWLLARSLENLFRFPYEELYDEDIAEVRRKVGCRGARIEGRVTGPRAQRDPRGRGAVASPA